MNGFCDAEHLQDLDQDPGGVELIPREAMPRRSGMSVVVIVPALAESNERNPPVVAGVISCGEPAPAPHMCSGVDQPGGVQTENHANEDAPQHQRKPAD